PELLIEYQDCVTQCIRRRLLTRPLGGGQMQADRSGKAKRQTADQHQTGDRPELPRSQTLEHSVGEPRDSLWYCTCSSGAERGRDERCGYRRGRILGQQQGQGPGRQCQATPAESSCKEFPCPGESSCKGTFGTPKMAGGFPVRFAFQVAKHHCRAV